MKEPVFLLQSGSEVMPSEKIACSFSNYPVLIAAYERLADMNLVDRRLNLVPVGSVEFTREYARCSNLELPDSLFYPEETHKYFYRKVRETTFEKADEGSFVKPSRKVKGFAAGVKGSLQIEVNPSEPVWESEVVPFESEFRFYIQDTIPKTQILGWARYDGLKVINPEPDLGMVEEIASVYRELRPGPNAYSIDIGWRPDLQRYCLVEVNDAWSLGYYDNQDMQSNPPTRQQYADMLVSRWTQIVFCNIV